MTYAESIEFLYGLRLFGVKLGLENTRKLAALAGTPQDQLRFIHIAGTNGKGSVAAMLESVYRAAGLRVGLFTSPHLVSFRERIQVNREMISETDVVRLVEELQAVSPTGDSPCLPSDHRPEARATFFEFVTVMALAYFREQRCDLVVWETGLGGRLDATNIVNPIASVITNVEHDHQSWLGHDVRSIATEKAGIIKPGIPVITATSDPEALAVIQETALALGSPLTLVTPGHTTHPPLDGIRLPLLGWHQRMNAATALMTVQALQNRLKVREKQIRLGLKRVSWPGRLQVIDRATSLQAVSETGDPSETEAGHGPRSQRWHRILLDGAHNASGATSLRAVLDEEFAGTQPTMILGILQDKDWGLMCEVLAPLADRIICVPVKSERGADPQKLAEACRRTNKTAAIEVMDSVTLALERTTEAGMVVIAGSLYLVGEALQVLGPDSHPQIHERSLNEWMVSLKR